MNKKIKITIAVIAMILVFLNLFELFENRYVVALCYLVITILLFTKSKGN